MKRRTGFSLIEVLAAVALIGIITFLALPNIVTVKADCEVNLAVARAEAVNMAMASYIQANGHATAVADWSAAGAAPDPGQTRYAMLAPFLAFAPASLDDYMPTGYSVGLPASISVLTKASLTGPSGSIGY